MTTNIEREFLTWKLQTLTHLILTEDTHHSWAVTPHSRFIFVTPIIRIIIKHLNSPRIATNTEVDTYTKNFCTDIGQHIFYKY